VGMNFEQIVGTYKLVAFDIESPEGVKSSWGKNLHGLLIYAATGHMSVSINKDVDPDPTQSDSENLFDSILFYAGTYQIEGVVIRHQVTEASNPSRIGKEMIRYAEWAGNELRLKTPKEAFGQATLVWRKL
jgi:hypothetical protein